MYHGRYESRTGAEPRGRKHSRKRNNRSKLFVTALLVLLTLSILGGATLAYLMTKTNQVVNTFTPGQVSCSVDQNFKVTNTSNVSAYIRAAIVVNWMDADGNIRAIGPVEGTDYTLSIGSGWTKIGEYYYYTSDVAANTPIEQTVCTVTLKDGITAPEGFTLVTEVVAEAIQAEGVKDGTDIKAVADAWGVTIYG